MKHKISNCLRELGIPANLSGYHYLRDAIKMTIDNNGVMPSATKCVYPELAKKYGTKHASIERCIRHVITRAFTIGNLDVTNEIFKGTIPYNKGKLTNKEFIATVADYLMLND